ncbi:iron ABC transporter [Photobacterium sp. GB-27]|uniref:FecCD family ABC transporter permease n=1 Tax=unclassified Photobacterium TaxID=2628852 RepID=UPI000D15E15B|nr:MULTISPECIES: iron ABC transporter permease [unclassified Photobacterium]PSV24506.1 iron ABC transporter [Photobacterium sp. GB-56]PSV34508.1 iron ABC transporter [Photobacterium sp. GB-27]PSV35035.1 iron ABC transporter [Photobacterium sp. GB-210]PSV41735.1 iron ABC transporter [Photobacterium sp. GB-36]PSV53960.1 iron ABC transporter [Photobacterium sp. GB-3]
MPKLATSYQWLLTSVIFIITVIAYLSLGSVSIPITDITGLLHTYLVQGSHAAAEQYPLANAIVLHIRLPRACAAILAGGALALAGACSQGLFKNPLASPDILGISAGSSFAAVIAIVTGISATAIGWLPLFTTIGALTSALLVYMLAAKSHQQGLFIILAGLAVSSLLGGLTMGVLLTAQQYEISEFVFWTMGGLDSRIWQQLLWPTPIIVIAAIVLLRHGQVLNLLALGEQNAHGMGVNVRRSRFTLLVLTTVLTAMAIAVAGPIGFIGLIVPHLVRLLLGPDNRRLLPFSAIFGALFLLLCDLLARTVIAPNELKTGIITAVIGGIYFIALLIRSQYQGIAQ